MRQRYLVRYPSPSGHVEVYNRYTNKSRKHLIQGFVYGQTLYDEATAKYPNYVHAEVWRLERLYRQSLTQ